MPLVRLATTRRMDNQVTTPSTPSKTAEERSPAETPKSADMRHADTVNGENPDVTPATRRQLPDMARTPAHSLVAKPGKSAQSDPPA